MAKQRPAAANYTVLARRYRPQQFADLIGQEAVAQALVNALKSNRVAHAYLFTGTRGVGKTSAARILAKALNCVKGPTPTPCDRCPSCQAIAVGEDVDVLEIDGASNRNLDDIRELRQNVQYKPIQSRFKIYIIDEVHQLTRDAFNALLKTLEEPPPHVKFIFATTDVQKVPATILSRCQRFDFAGISTSRIVERLREVVSAEGAEADDEALELIARRAAHSMRDAQSLLDQCLAFGGPRLTAERVRQLLGIADDDLVAELAAAVLAKDVAQALSLFDSACQEGVQFGELTDHLMAYWRDLLLVKTAGPDYAGLMLSRRWHDALRRQAELLRVEDILTGLDLIAGTSARLRNTNHGRILVEILLVRLGRLENLISMVDLGAGLVTGKPAGTNETSRTAATGTLPVRSAETTLPPRRSVSAPVSAAGASPEDAEVRSRRASSLPWNGATLNQIWDPLVSGVGMRIAALMEHAERQATSGPDCLLLRFPVRYNRDAEELRDPERLKRVEAVLTELTGRPIAVRVTVAESDSADAAERRTVRPLNPRTKALENPLVRRAVDLFEAQFYKADEGFGSLPHTKPAEAEE
jgi:DNA polymerase-3 subunit gamma/tau